jgi:hypothetical protein
LLALHRWRMSPPRLDDDPFYFYFADEFLAEFGFGNFLPTEGSLFSFGSYNDEFDDASFTFSVESYVGDNRPRRKKRLAGNVAFSDVVRSWF